MAKKSPREKQLEVLLRIRRLEEDLAKGELAKANAATRRAEDDLMGAKERYVAEVKPPQSADVAAFRAHLAHGTSAAAMVRGAERNIETAQRAALDAREVVQKARIKSQGLERLVDKVREAAFAEMLAADQRTAEESRAGHVTKGRR